MGLRNYARVTKLERKQRVQTFIDLTVPFCDTLTFFTLAFHILLDLL